MKIEEIKLSIKCPLCGEDTEFYHEPFMVITRDVKNPIYWDMNVYQFQCKNKHIVYLNYNQIK